MPGVAPKTDRRIWIVDKIMECLCSDHIFRTLNYRRRSESYLKQYMHQPLQASMVEIMDRIDPRLSDKAKERRAASALFWEGDVNTTVNHVRFLGVQHRPDFVVKAGGIKIAVEVKRGSTGSAIREGIGQSLVYAGSEDFDFVVYLFADTSRDKKILESLDRGVNEDFIESLWGLYNIRFSVV